jgi:putative ABC transport system permease protein
MGLSYYDMQKRTKEIGIRKANGASREDIMLLVNKEFSKWIIVGLLIACPISWFVMQRWLQNFAYKTSIDWWIFVLAGLLTLFIALLTVSWNTYRAAIKNPVDALRYE